MHCGSRQSPIHVQLLICQLCLNDVASRIMMHASSHCNTAKVYGKTYVYSALQVGWDSEG